MALTKRIPWWFTAKPCKTFQAIINNDMSTVSSRSESFQICISFFTFPTWCPSPQPTQAEPERWSRKWPWKRKPWRFGGVKNLEAFEKKKGGCQPRYDYWKKSWTTMSDLATDCFNIPKLLGRKVTYPTFQVVEQSSWTRVQGTSHSQTYLTYLIAYETTIKDSTP